MRNFKNWFTGRGPGNIAWKATRRSLPEPHLSRWLVLLTLLLPAANLLAQGVPRIRPAQPVRMQIRENPPAPATSYSYTIIGAVPRAGVFRSNLASVPLQELITAAGGAPANGQFTTKIFRSQRASSVQMQFGEAQPGPVETLEPGDVLIISAVDSSPAGHSGGDELVSIACIGLTAEPVVLHLDQQIPDVQELARRLRQQESVARSASVVGPSGRLIAGKFVNGTVVVFDPRQIDAAQLALTPPFPEPMQLAPRQLGLGPVPATQPAGERPAADDPIEISQFLPPGPGTQPVAPLSFGAAAALPALEAIPLPPADSLVTTELPFTPLASAPGLPLAAAPAPSAPLSRIVPAINIAPQPLAADPIGSVRLQAPPSTTPALSGTDSSVWPLTLSVTLLAVACMILSVFWSRWDAQQLAAAISRRTAPLTRAAEVEDADQSPSASPLEELLQGVLPMIEEPVKVTGTWPLHGAVVGHRRVRIDAAHEQIAGPHFGKPETRGARSKVAAGRARIDERSLRKSLRAGIEPTAIRWESDENHFHGDEPVHADPLGPSEVYEHPAAIPAAPAAAPPFEELAAAGEDEIFDIVQPAEPLLHQQARGALERALRTLDSEKRS